MSICRERRRERGKEREAKMSVYIEAYIYIYIVLFVCKNFICVKGVREGGREPEMQGACKARV
jgi:hypothetical protein